MRLQDVLHALYIRMRNSICAVLFCSRVVSLLTNDWTLSMTLRCPAISRLQKIYNVQLAIRTLEAAGADTTDAKGGQSAREYFSLLTNVQMRILTEQVRCAGVAIEARDIVDGHREKTLQLLWLLIFHFKVSDSHAHIQYNQSCSFTT